MTSRFQWILWKMTINDFKVQIATAYPDLQEVRTRKNRTLRGEIETDQGKIRAYIKLLTIGDVAKEALCSVLARKLHLPVPQPYYVYIDPKNTGQKFSNLHGIAFGSEEEILPLPRIKDPDIIKKQLLSWSELDHAQPLMPGLLTETGYLTICFLKVITVFG